MSRLQVFVEFHGGELCGKTLRVFMYPMTDDEKAEVQREQLEAEKELKADQELRRQLQKENVEKASRAEINDASDRIHDMLDKMPLIFRLAGLPYTIDSESEVLANRAFMAGLFEGPGAIFTAIDPRHRCGTPENEWNKGEFYKIAEFILLKMGIAFVGCDNVPWNGDPKEGPPGGLSEEDDPQPISRPDF